MTDILRIDGLSEVMGGYAAIFCDVWGVLHDGERKSPSAEAALVAARSAGRKVVLLTNSPRPASNVALQLDSLRATREAYDFITTSGDVTRALIAKAGHRLLHVGPARDVDLFAGLDVATVGEDEAEAVIVTGLYDDENELPELYAPLLKRLKWRGLPMICANPDVIVHRGGRLIWCAGSLARDYAAIGGEVRMAGKPYRPIYELAAEGAGISGPGDVLAIGDGLNTDIRGANQFGADALLIVGGIHGEELGGVDAEADALAASLEAQNLSARYFMHALA